MLQSTTREQHPLWAFVKLKQVAKIITSTMT